MSNDSLRRGLIVKGVGGLYEVESDGERLRCRPRGKLRIGDGAPAVGDWVTVRPNPDGEDVIWGIENRKNHLIRPALSNIDTLIILASAAPPVTQYLLIDKVSAIAAHRGVDVLICINKCDIDPGDELYETYTASGFRVIRTSAVTGEGLDELRAALSNGISALTGNSGVGKSSLLNRIDPAWSAQVGELSSKIGRGKNTTRHVELYPLSGGGYLADTPGFSSFDVERLDLVDREQLQHAFRDFTAYIPRCRYTGCAHIRERGCAVRAAVTRGEICQSRYDSYLWLWESMKDYHHWEQKPENGKGIQKP